MCPRELHLILQILLSLSCYHFVLEYTLGVEGSRAGGKRAISVPVSSLAVAVCTCAAICWLSELGCSQK